MTLKAYPKKYKNLLSCRRSIKDARRHPESTSSGATASNYATEIKTGNNKPNKLIN